MSSLHSIPIAENDEFVEIPVTPLGYENIKHSVSNATKSPRNVLLSACGISSILKALWQLATAEVGWRSCALSDKQELCDHVIP